MPDPFTTFGLLVSLFAFLRSEIGGRTSKDELLKALEDQNVIQKYLEWLRRKDQGELLNELQQVKDQLVHQHEDIMPMLSILAGHPFVEFQYPVEWDWNALREASVINNKLTSGRFTEDNTCDAETSERTLLEIMVQHLNILALQDLTNHAWIEKSDGKYNSVLPEQICEELNAIKNKRTRQEALDRVMRPFSIGAASIDCGDAEFKDGVCIPKSVAKQLANIGELIDIPKIGFHGEINLRKIDVSLIFQIHPLIIDFDKRKAYHSLTIGLFETPQLIENRLVTTTLSDWPQADLEIFWKELFQEVSKITDFLIPKEESQTSKILILNAQLEIPLSSSNFEEENAASKRVFEALSPLGRVTDIRSMAPTSGEMHVTSKHATEVPRSDDRAPASATEGMFQLIWKLPFLRWPIIALLALLSAAIAVFAVLPDETKIKLLKYLGLG